MYKGEVLGLSETSVKQYTIKSDDFGVQSVNRQFISNTMPKCERCNGEHQKGYCPLIKCWTCSKFGHHYKKCPNDYLCTYCSQYGHFTDCCPLQDLLCFTCNGRGHTRNKCLSLPAPEKCY